MKQRIDQLLSHRPVLVAIVGALLIQHPLALASAGIALGLRTLWKRRSARRTRACEIPNQQAVLARVVLVGLTAGLPLARALELAHDFVSGEVAMETEAVIRRSRRQGMSLALSQSGPKTRPMLARLAMAAASGAPVAEAVATYLAEVRQERRTSALEKVRRLPVTLMIPLGLLILPGFVVLFVGPIIFRSLSDLIVGLP